MTPNFTLARRAVFLAAVLLVAAPSAWAFRCNSYVIDVGLHKTEVMKKCGARPPRTPASNAG
jgi:hypothetical protein